jgi:hypothetical protein
MRRIIALTALLALSIPALAETMQPGLYRATTVSPGEKPETSDECVTQKDIDDGLSALGAARDGSCKVEDINRGANQVSDSTPWPSKGVNNASQAKITFTRDTFDMKLAMTVAGEKTDIHVTGKRVGACK